MAIFFDKVPREIRDKIYELLLVDHDVCRDIHLNVEKWSSPKSDLCPAILRTCKQAYTEGLPVLYEQNSFRYDVENDNFVITDSLKDKIDKIKHVRDSRARMQRSKSISD